MRTLRRIACAGALASWATMTDLLVRLFCHTHTCHSHAYTVPYSGVLSLSLSQFSPLFAQCSPRLKFIWLWPKGDGLWVFRPSAGVGVENQQKPIPFVIFAWVSGSWQLGSFSPHLYRLKGSEKASVVHQLQLSLTFRSLLAPPHTLAHTHFCPNRQRLRRKAAKKRRNLKEKKKKRGRQKQTFRCSSFIASFWLVTVIWPLWKDMRSWQQQTAVRVSPLSLFLTSWGTTTNGTAINCQKHSLKIAYFAGHSALLFGESTLIWFFIYPVQMVLHLKPKIKNWGNGLLHYLNKFFDDKYVWAIFSQLWYLRRDCTNFFLHFKLK